MVANAVAVAATRAVAKVNPMPPSDINQMNHPTSDMVGKYLGSTDDPMMCKFKMSMPSRYMACLPTIRHLMWRTLPMRMSITPLLYLLSANNPKLIMHMSQTMGETHEISHHNLADFEPCLGYATEGQAVGGIPLQNPLEGPQYHPQLHLLHSTTSKNPHAREKAQGH